MNRHTRSNVLKRAKEGFTRQQIAKECGLDYGAVCKILREAGQGKESEPKQRHSQAEALAMYTRPHTRCPGCGALTQLPCLECGILLDNFIKRAVKKR